MVGRTISHYEITAKIGEGGMGVVYKAVDIRLNRTVAIKVLGPSFEGDIERRQRFVFEAKAASALNHPNIITIYDIDRAGEVDFIAMEYVPGRTLAERIGSKGMALGDAMRYLIQVADALAAAHSAGIMHRDLKPANIMTTDSGGVKLLDFGLAKPTGLAQVAASAPTVSERLNWTGPGTIVGTSAYMSPEQVRGAHVDQRTDVWAFGCVMYECFTGRRAFEGSSYADVLARILEAEPDFSALPRAISPALRRLLRACLRKDSSERPRSIDPTFLQLSSEPEDAGRSRPRLPLAIAFAVTAAFGALAGAWFTSRVSPSSVADESVVRLSIPFASVAQSREWSWPVLAVSPDSRATVYSAAGSNGERRLYYRKMDRSVSVALAGTEGAVSPFFSPDGKWVGFFAGAKLKKVSIPEGIVQTVTDASSSYGGAWGPDDTIWFPAASFAGGLMRISSAGGTPQSATRLQSGEASHRWPSVSSDGTALVYTSSNSTGPGLEEPRIVVQSLTSEKRTTLPVAATFARFAPDGRHMFLVRDGAMMAVPFDSMTLTAGAAVPLMEGVMQASTGAAQIDASSTVLAFLEGAPETRRLVWVDREGRITPLDAPPRLYAHPRLSPDARTVAVTITEPKNDIWTYDISLGTLSRLTTEGASNAYPIWTPDGRKITYVSSQDGRPPNLFWKSADGTGPAERLVSSANTEVSETWLPDGKTLIFVELRPGPTGWDILTLPLAGPRKPIAFLESPYCDCTPQISPSGRYLAHTSTETGRGEIQIRSFPNPGVKVTVSSTGGAAAAWRGDERELYYVSDDAMMAASVSPGPPLVVGKPTVLFRGEFASIQGKNYDVTRDGQRFLMVRIDERERPQTISFVLNWRRDFEALQRSGGR